MELALEVGKDVATVSAPSMVVEPLAIRPATAKAIAIRWSPRASRVMPLRSTGPETASPLGNVSTLAPMRRRPPATVSIRSDSFTRSSAQSRKVVVPSHWVARTARTGTSSMRRGDEIARDAEGAQGTRRPEAQVGDGLAQALAERALLDGDPRLAQGVEETGAGGVHPDLARDELAPGQDRGGDGEEGGAGDVPRHREAEAVELGGSGQGRCGPFGSERHPEGAEHPLGVVAREARLDYRGRPLGAESGEEDGRFDLRARNRALVGDTAQISASDREREGVALDVGAHEAQGIGDAAHGAARERGVADEPRLQTARGEEAGQKAGGRPRVAAVEIAVGSPPLAGVILRPSPSSIPTPRARRHASVARGSSPRRGVATTEGVRAIPGEERGAVGERLIARWAHLALQGRHRIDRHG